MNYRLGWAPRVTYRGRVNYPDGVGDLVGDGQLVHDDLVDDRPDVLAPTGEMPAKDLDDDPVGQPLVAGIAVDELVDLSPERQQLPVELVHQGQNLVRPVLASDHLVTVPVERLVAVHQVHHHVGNQQQEQVVIDPVEDLRLVEIVGFVGEHDVGTVVPLLKEPDVYIGFGIQLDLIELTSQLGGQRLAARYVLAVPEHREVAESQRLTVQLSRRT